MLIILTLFVCFSVHPMQTNDGDTNTEAKNSILGYLNVSIYCLAALRSTMNELPETSVS